MAFLLSSTVPIIIKKRTVFPGRGKKIIITPTDPNAKATRKVVYFLCKSIPVNRSE